MKMYAEIKDGKIIKYCKGFIPSGPYIELDDNIAKDPNRFTYREGKFEEKKVVAENSETKEQQLEKRIEQLESLVQTLSKQEVI